VVSEAELGLEPRYFMSMASSDVQMGIKTMGLAKREDGCQ
jgi:hypothetical protein